MKKQQKSVWPCLIILAVSLLLWAAIIYGVYRLINAFGELPPPQEYDCELAYEGLEGCWHWRFSPRMPTNDDATEWDYVLVSGGTMFCAQIDDYLYECVDEHVGLLWDCVTNEDLSEIVCEGEMSNTSILSDSRMIASMFQEGYYWGDVITNGKQFIAWRP